MKIKETSTAEKIAGSMSTELALTAIGVAGTSNVSLAVMGALLPVLAKSFASERQKERVEQTLTAIADTLNKHENLIQNMSDDQYKIINEVVLTVLQTTQAEKMVYLRAVIENAITDSKLLSLEASIISRVIRDISAAEIIFLMDNFHYSGIALTEIPQPDSQLEDNILHVSPSSPRALHVSGLLTLGLLVSSETTWDIAPLRFTRIVARLIALLKLPA